MKIKNLFGTLFAALALALMAASCGTGNEPSRLTAGTAKKLAVAYLTEHKITPQYVSFTVGRFECNDKDSRKKYRELEAAGIITLAIDTTTITRTVENGYDYWTGRRKYSKKTERHFTLTTTLTEEAEAQAEKQRPNRNYVDPDMVQPERGDFPEFHLDEVTYNTPDVKESEPASKSVYFKGTDLTVIKVRNIKMDPTNRDKAEFEAVIQNGLVTPAYRVFFKEYDYEKSLCKIKLQYYLDKGWAVTEFTWL